MLISFPYLGSLTKYLNVVILKCLYLEADGRTQTRWCWQTGRLPAGQGTPAAVSGLQSQLPPFSPTSRLPHRNALFQEALWFWFFCVYNSAFNHATENCELLNHPEEFIH